jgi:glycerol-3-phosphate acyltransferase PlsY
VNPLPFFLLAYLLGSIPFALVVSLPQGVDPRKAGSKNPGATNVARLLGKKWGVITFLGDLGKGIIALFIAKFATGLSFQEAPSLYAGVALFAVLGHMYSLFLKIKGGKGVATTIGTFLVLTPLPSLLSLIFFLLMVYLTNYVSVGSLTFSLVLPILIYFFNYPKEYFFISLALTLLIWIKHRDNIKRLLKGEENPWNWKRKN